MRAYEFMLTLATEPDLDATDQLYEYFDDNGAAPENVLDFTLVIQSGCNRGNPLPTSPSMTPMAKSYRWPHQLRTVLWKPRRSRQP